jgi:hypothetical protein
MSDTIPWYRSHVIVAALISVLSKVLVLTGLTQELNPDDQSHLTDLVVLVVGGLADIWTMRSRIVQTTAPSITLKGG